MAAEIEDFIRDAAQKRGIDPDTAVKVARSEGGVDQYAAHGDFDTGDSWWPFQLHYGGVGYEKYGTVAGMGVGFTALTGWQPGDPAAWRDSVRYALNRAKASGWSAWYGAAHVGVGQWDGIDRTHPWDAAAEPWDFETGRSSVVTSPTYNLDLPIVTQNHDWDCAEQSTLWAVTAAGRHPSDAWMEQAMLSGGIESTDLGLLVGDGSKLAQWITEQYSDGSPTLRAHNVSPVGFDEVRSVAGTMPVLLGGHHWGAAGHWTGVRGYDAAADALVLANPGGTGPVYGQQTLSRQQFDSIGPCSMVVVMANGAAPADPPPPPAVPTPSQGITRDEIDAMIATLTGWRDRVQT